jgi:uncharacterized protein (DUF1778 family)
MTAKETVLRFRASEKEKALIKKAAAARNLSSVSEYVRMIVLDDAKRVIAKERAWR